MKEILFEYKSGPSFGFFGKHGADSIVVFSDGSIVQRSYMFDEHDPYSEEEIAFLPEVVESIKRVLIEHADNLKKISCKLNNGTLDGSYDCFQFGKKKISSWSICRCDINDVKHRNPSYYQKYKDNMVQENMVLDIYNEIISVLNEFELGMELKKK